MWVCADGQVYLDCEHLPVDGVHLHLDSIASIPLCDSCLCLGMMPRVRGEDKNSGPQFRD